MDSSRRSTPKYRTVSLGSNVDESLFSSSNGKRRIVYPPIPSTAVVISPHELARIQQESVIKTDAQLKAEREEAERRKEEKEKASRDRKLKMKALEKKAAQFAKKSDFEIAEEARAQALKDMAAKKMDENSDVVKLLNSMAMRAVAYSLRDQQLEEKKRLEQLDKEYERRMEVMTEIDRIKDIQRREEEETQKRNKRIADRSTITDQIEERKREKLLALEAREQENQAMRNTMQKYADEDRVANERRQKSIELSRLEVIKANEQAIARKREAKEKEKKEVEDILIYQAMQDAKLAKREEEELAIENAKKERQKKLLDQQEKAQNNAGKLDELRARRAAEEKERQLRKKEREEVLKRKNDMKQLMDARAQQAADKAARAELSKKAAEEEVLQGLLYAKKLEEREEYEQRVKADKAREHREKLQAQIDEIRRIRNSPEYTGPDNESVRLDLLREEERLKVIRDKMVRDLTDQGVNPKYLSEMKGVDIGKILRR